MKKITVEIEMDEDVVDKVRTWMRIEEEYPLETAEDVVREMFYLIREGECAVDLRDKVKVTSK